MYIILYVYMRTAAVAAPMTYRYNHIKAIYPIYREEAHNQPPMLREKAKDSSGFPQHENQLNMPIPPNPPSPISFPLLLRP